jgi:hypothetical protein
MGLEVSTTISGLNKLWPLGSDPKSQGDDHLRMLKSVLQARIDDSGTIIKFKLDDKTLGQFVKPAGASGGGLQILGNNLSLTPPAAPDSTQTYDQLNFNDGTTPNKLRSYLRADFASSTAWWALNDSAAVEQNRITLAATAVSFACNNFQMIPNSAAQTYDQIGLYDSAVKLRHYQRIDFTSDTLSLVVQSAAPAVLQTVAINNAGMTLGQGAAAGTVLTTGNRGPQVSASGLATVFPVGHMVLAFRAGGLLINNQAAGLAVDPGGAKYEVIATGTQLAGTWCVRGQTGSAQPYDCLMQRVA